MRRQAEKRFGAQCSGRCSCRGGQASCSRPGTAGQELQLFRGRQMRVASPYSISINQVLYMRHWAMTDMSAAVSIYQNDREQNRGQIYGAVVTSLVFTAPATGWNMQSCFMRSTRIRVPYRPSRNFTIRLRDANYQEVATNAMTTDAWGRAQGLVRSPEEGLTGKFLSGVCRRGHNRRMLVYGKAITSCLHSRQR